MYNYASALALGMVLGVRSCKGAAVVPACRRNGVHVKSINFIGQLLRDGWEVDADSASRSDSLRTPPASGVRLTSGQFNCAGYWLNAARSMPLCNGCGVCHTPHGVVRREMQCGGRFAGWRISCAGEEINKEVRA